MIVELILADGVGKAPPLVVRCTQVVIKQDNGTPIGVFAHYGPEGAYAASMAARCPKCNAPFEDFHRLLRSLGIDTTVIVDRLQLSAPPSGAKLIAGPDVS